jgi:SAM-dependent methyltransferase
VEIYEAYRCPTCIGPLTSRANGLECHHCGIGYPIAEKVADFSGGHYYDHFDEAVGLTAPHIHTLELEIEGAVTRIKSYYLPQIASAFPKRSARILDAGCGNGISVDLLLAAGYDAWGIDLSALRRWQWQDRSNAERLAVADGARLPFPNSFFDVVLCSGVLEHIGVQEILDGAYTVTVLPERDAARRAFLVELLRVIAPGGALYLDFPNGYFPIDFWHNTRPGKARWHSLRERFLPTFEEVRGLLKQINAPLAISALSPNRRLAFRQVRQHWYGRLLAGPARLFFELMDRAPILARSALNPYLVIRVVKTLRHGDRVSA